MRALPFSIGPIHFVGIARRAVARLFAVGGR
jgi:hypothetical protein